MVDLSSLEQAVARYDRPDRRRQHFSLARLDGNLFVGRTPPGHWLPLELLIRFVGESGAKASSLVVTTGRTKGLRPSSPELFRGGRIEAGTVTSQAARRRG